MLPLQPLQRLGPLRQIRLTLDHLLGLMIQHDQIPALEIEPVQLVAGLLGVDDVLVHDKRRAFGVVGDALADLAHGAEFAEEVEEFFGRDGVGEIFDVECAEGEGSVRL